MSLSFFVAGRLALPPRTKEETGPWSLSLAVDEDDDLGLDAGETTDEDGWIARIVGFPPTTIIGLDPAWQASEAVARELARALEGVVFCDGDKTVSYDARGCAEPSETLGDLETRLRATFLRACAEYLDAENAAAAEEKRRFDRLVADDPQGIAADNDWSDVATMRVARPTKGRH